MTLFPKLCTPGWVLDSFGASQKNGIWAAASFPIPFPSSTPPWAVRDTNSENALWKGASNPVF